jgi:hypothetical protein
MSNTPVWVVEMGAFAASASALFVLGGGLWAYFRFRKDAPYIARANLVVSAELMTYQDEDLLRVKCTASAIGRGRFTFIKDDEVDENGEGYELPNVAIYAMTPDLLQEPPDEWTDVLAEVKVFADDESVEAGEIIEEVTLIWVGERPERTVAYRVAASFAASDKEKRDPYTWQAVAVVPIDGLLQGDSNMGTSSGHGAPR